MYENRSKYATLLFKFKKLMFNLLWQKRLFDFWFMNYLSIFSWQSLIFSSRFSTIYFPNFGRTYLLTYHHKISPIITLYNISSLKSFSRIFLKGTDCIGMSHSYLFIAKTFRVSHIHTLQAFLNICQSNYNRYLQNTIFT